MDFKYFALKSEISKRFILVGGGGGRDPSYKVYRCMYVLSQGVWI